MSDFLFTSESVSEGHPDKVADQISDAVLDAILALDPHGRVAAETLVSTGLVVMTGEITTEHKHDYARIARDTIHRIGYSDPELRFDSVGCAVMQDRDSLLRLDERRCVPPAAQCLDQSDAGGKPAAEDDQGRALVVERIRLQDHDGEIVGGPRLVLIIRNRRRFARRLDEIGRAHV